MSTVLTPQRRIRVFTVGISAAVSLYFLAALVAEPLRAFALTETVIVSVTIGDESGAGGIGFACDGNNDGNTSSGETLSLGTILFTGDTSAYADSRAAHCRVKTNNSNGYTISWQVVTGSGGAFTGHLISQHNDIIPAFGTGTVSSTFARSWQLTPPSNTNDSRWGGRVSSTSSGSAVSLDFGTDITSEKWARVITGSSLPIRQSLSPTQGGLIGDVIHVGFRVQVGATKSQDTGIYKATVTFTAAMN